MFNKDSVETKAFPSFFLDIELGCAQQDGYTSNLFSHLLTCAYFHIKNIHSNVRTMFIVNVHRLVNLLPSEVPLRVCFSLESYNKIDQ